MDPLSITTGIVGLLDLSMKLVNLINSIKNSPKSAEELLGKLGALNQVLSQFSSFLGSENRKGDSFDQSSTLCSAVNACKDTLQYIFGKLDKHTKTDGLHRTLEKFKWPFMEDEHLKTIETLHGYVQIFHFSLTIDGWLVTQKLTLCAGGKC